MGLLVNPCPSISVNVGRKLAVSCVSSAVVSCSVTVASIPILAKNASAWAAVIPAALTNSVKLFKKSPVSKSAPTSKLGKSVIIDFTLSNWLLKLVKASGDNCKLSKIFWFAASANWLYASSLPLIAAFIKSKFSVERKNESDKTEPSISNKFP